MCWEHVLLVNKESALAYGKAEHRQKNPSRKAEKKKAESGRCQQLPEKQEVR